MAEFTITTALGGGLLIGLAATLLLLGIGRIAGVSGILGGVLGPVDKDTPWRGAFLAGLLLGGGLWILLSGEALQPNLQSDLPVTILAGLLVGYGTRLGSGCTSGHGVCGLARLSARSLAATTVFMATAAVTVFVVHHVLGG